MNEVIHLPLLERYQRLIAIARDLASTLNLDALLHRIVCAATDLSLAEEASILLFDSSKNELRFQAATNLENPEIQGMSVPVDRSIAGWIVTHGEPLIIDDVRSDARHFGHINRVSDVRTRSILGVPLIHKEKVIGALEAINRREGRFDQDDQELLMTLGAQAAVAIENARLFQQSDLIAEFVHELRTPLASLHTAAHLLGNDKISPERKDQLIEAIQSETTRLSSLSTSFLDLARLESGRSNLQFQKCNPRKLLSECLSLMQTQAQANLLTLQMATPGQIQEIRCDYNKIKQALLNLLSNAIKYNRPGGNITLSLENQPDAILITVADSGIGIPPEHLPHLFTRFYRVPGADEHAQGTGLGLSIVRRIVEAHGGSIGVESTLGEGTRFIIRLPLSPP